MTTTPNLGITLLESGQLQPDVTINQALSDIDELVATKALGINVQAGSSYTLALTDAGKLVEFTSGAAVTVTVPADSSTDFPLGSEILLRQAGDGKVTLEEEDSNVAIETPETLSLAKKYAGASLVKVAANTWWLEGRLEST